MSVPRGINTKERGFVIDVNESIIDCVHEMDVDREEARMMVKNNKHNCITATYYLLLSKRTRDPNSLPLVRSIKSKGSGNGNSPIKTLATTSNDTINISKIVGTINES